MMIKSNHMDKSAFTTVEIALSFALWDYPVAVQFSQIALSSMGLPVHIITQLSRTCNKSSIIYISAIK